MPKAPFSAGSLDRQIHMATIPCQGRVKGTPLSDNRPFPLGPGKGCQGFERQLETKDEESLEWLMQRT